MNNFSDKVTFIGSLTDLILDQPQRSLKIIRAVSRALEKEIMVMQREVAG